MPERHTISDPDRENDAGRHEIYIGNQEKFMANKNSKNSNLSRSSESKSMQKYEDQRKRLNNGAKIMAILVAVAMIVTTFLASGVFFLD